MLATKVTDFFKSLRVHKQFSYTLICFVPLYQDKIPEEGCILYYTLVKAALHY